MDVSSSHNAERHRHTDRQVTVSCQVAEKNCAKKDSAVERGNSKLL